MKTAKDMKIWVVLSIVHFVLSIIWLIEGDYLRAFGIFTSGFLCYYIYALKKELSNKEHSVTINIYD